ncbi:MAG: carbamoyltransferase HypF [bacterium JZ-2024 1]
MRVVVRGAVQGVGFRPFIYRLATEMGVKGWVINSSQGVFIEAEEEKKVLDEFVLRIEKEKPPLARIQSLEFSFLDPVGYSLFEIRESEEEGEKTVLVLPDIATCEECMGEVWDPEDRRFRYPFTNCTNCGPRFTIIESLPYDRPRTSMKIFPMCPDCEREYHNPADRRFHAQPIACPVCGPHLELWAKEDRGKDSEFAVRVEAKGDEALKRSVREVLNGKILGFKGLGGFLLVVDAYNQQAIQQLRYRKPRRDKPFALMFPDLAQVKRHCEVSPLEERALLSPEHPIVLLRRRAESDLPENIAPGNPYLGVMLPYTPMHSLFMKEMGKPVIATSGNLTDEPICTDEKEAFRRLGKICDLFLVHNRPIVRHADDSIVRVMVDREIVMRRARGYAPLPIHLKNPVPTILALGGHLKNTIALSVGSNVFISQHLGDLETAESLKTFERTISDFLFLYEARPVAVACDLHPDYLSTQWAEKWTRENGLPLIKVQHHFAHIASCMAENEIYEEVLGISWDGTGYGTDGTVWGGEFLLCSPSGFQRVAHLRPFRLPGGDVAIQEPRRVALGLLYEIFGESLLGGATEEGKRKLNLPTMRAFSLSEIKILIQMMKRGVNAPLTSSAGRLFDAVASLLGLFQEVTFEAQAAMAVEFEAEKHCSARLKPFPFEMKGENPIILDWEPAIREMIMLHGSGEEPSRLCARFHLTLVEMMVQVARRTGKKKVLLSGGCFQNALLTQLAYQRLSGEGFRVYTHQRVPPNDGGISLGQIFIASRQYNEKGGGK